MGVLWIWGFFVGIFVCSFGLCRFSFNVFGVFFFGVFDVFFLFLVLLGLVFVCSFLWFVQPGFGGVFWSPFMAALNHRGFLLVLCSLRYWFWMVLYLDLLKNPRKNRKTNN